MGLSEPIGGICAGKGKATLSGGWVKPAGTLMGAIKWAFL